MWFAGAARLVPEAGRPSSLRTGFSLAPGMRVGLYGGSFNPAHEGHSHVAETALVRLGLDRVIWLVSPQNPLKSSTATASLAERMAGARARARGPNMVVSDLEAFSLRFENLLSEGGSAAASRAPAAPTESLDNEVA